MSIYSKNDFDVLLNNIDKINDDIKRIKSNLYKPDLTEKKKIQSLILDYIKRKNKKIYGGYALNKLLMDKNYKSIYKDYETPDIDFYSVDPNTDIIELCNKLHELNYKVSAREAKHPNTYSIFVEYDLYCDITYAPSCIYNTIPIIKIDEINYVNPSFMIIDYLKMITDPLSSYWRIQKSFERLIYLEQAYPLPKFIKSIEINETESDKIILESLEIILDEVRNLSDIVMVGYYSYLFFLKTSKFFRKNKNLLEFSRKTYSNLPYLEIISKNFKSDSLRLIDKLKEYSDLVTYTEYHPFFTFLSNSVEVYLNDNLIMIIYDYGNRAIPYIVENNIKIGSFAQSLMYAQANVIKHRTQQNEELKYMYMLMVSHLIQMRFYYFEINKHQSIMDDTPFKEFVLDFVAPSENPEHEMLVKCEKRKAKNKPSIFIYDPSRTRKEEKVENFFFPNISGNEITNTKRQVLNTVPVENDQNSIDNDEIKNDI